MLEHGLGEDERPDEGEDGAGAQGRQHGVGAFVAADPEQREQRGADQTGDRDRDRLGDPGNDHTGENRRDVVLRLVDVQRQQEHDDRDQRRQEEADRTPCLLEPLLAR